jgi:2-polyprenyl-3-methyl-5-hydroxy-6-metoxy-1,4-benzoquinol methylase
MITEIEQLDYKRKPADYFQCPRPEMLPFVPVGCRRVLDVGCAEGAFGESLKRSRGIEVWGVEPTASAAAIAKGRLDNVIEGVFGPEINLPKGIFDCILFNDVLEHMLAPEMALRYAWELLAPGGVDPKHPKLSNILAIAVSCSLGISRFRCTGQNTPALFHQVEHYRHV